MQKLFIPVLAGTTRRERKSIRAAQLVVKVGKELEKVKTQLVDPNNYNFPHDGNDVNGKDPKYTKITHQADGFFIVVPEYNHGYPGSLKRMLDSELQNYIHKPVAFAGVSSGQWGGVRAIENLVPVVRELGMIATFVDVQFPKIENIFNEKGELQDKSFIKRVKRAWTELIWMARILAWGRKNLPGQYRQ